MGSLPVYLAEETDISFQARLCTWLLGDHFIGSLILFSYDSEDKAYLGISSGESIA